MNNLQTASKSQGLLGVEGSCVVSYSTHPQAMKTVDQVLSCPVHQVSMLFPIYPPVISVPSSLHPDWINTGEMDEVRFASSRRQQNVLNMLSQNMRVKAGDYTTDLSAMMDSP